MITQKSSAELVAEAIKTRFPAFNPKIGVVLGSGLGSFADNLDQAHSLSYDEFQGFPKVSVQGHSGNIVLGKIDQINVVCLQGRAHPYEGANYESIKTYVRMLKLLGCEYFFATNAAGSMREDVPPGELMLITDHINFQHINPLIGLNDEEFGPRFFPLDNAYDLGMREKLLKIAEREDIHLPQGVYISVLGPNFETAAEIRAFRMLGADVVGMSTVPEVLVANHCGMKVSVISMITNFATGLAKTSHSHDEVLKTASRSAEKLNRLIKKFIMEL